jgi:hypothetical protein
MALHMVFDAAYFCYRRPGARRLQNRMFTNYVMLILARPTARSPSSFHGGVCALRVDGSIEVFDETTAAEYVKRVLTQQPQP